MSSRFPNEMACHIRITTRQGKVIEIEKSDYEGFITRPMSWQHALKKFTTLAAPYADETLRRQISDHVYNIESHPVSSLTELLTKIRKLS
jgi:2-methylcitrate dehydratase